MFSWIELAILLLTLANKLVNWLHDRGMIDEGRRQILAELAGNIANKVKIRDEIKREVEGMSEAEVDKGLADLVRPSGVGGAAPRMPAGRSDGGAG